MPIFRLATINLVEFEINNVDVVAIAAPIAPKFNINIKFKIKFNITVKKDMYP